MSLPAWKRRAMERSKLAKFEREQRSPFLHSIDMQEIVRMTGITSNSSQIINGLKLRRLEMIDKKLARYYAAKLAVASKRGDYGRFMAEVAVLNAEETAVNAALDAGQSAAQIEKLSPDLIEKVGKIEAGRHVDVNGLALPAELKASAPSAKKSNDKPAVKKPDPSAKKSNDKPAVKKPDPSDIPF